MNPISELIELPPAPRNICLSSAGKLRLVSPLVFLVIVIAILYWWIARSNHHMVELAERGRHVEANVTGTHVSSGKSGDAYFLDYQFESSGKRYFGSEDVDLSVYVKAQTHREYVEITYLPDNPSEYEYGSVNIPVANRALKADYLCTPYWLSVPVLWLLIVIVQTCHDYRFARRCLLTQGQILKIMVDVQTTNRGGIVTYGMSYEFSVDGSSFKKSVEIPGKFKRSHEIGERISVFYSLRNPNVSKLSFELTHVAA